MERLFSERTPEEQRVLQGLAEEYLGLVALYRGNVSGPCGDPLYSPDGDSQLLALQDHLLTLLGVADADFDLVAWATTVTNSADALEDATPPGVDELWRVKVGERVGILCAHTNGPAHSLRAVVQLTPERFVIVAAEQANEVDKAEATRFVQEQIRAAVHQASFLGLDELTTRLLCEDALATFDDVEVNWPPEFVTDYGWAPTQPIPWEDYDELVEVTDLELLGDYRVRLRFTDGVTRTLDLDRWLTGPVNEYIRPQRRFVQVRIVNGALTWPNGVCFRPDDLRYFPARKPYGWKDEV